MSCGSDVANESLECKICNEIFSATNADLTPRILRTCGHTICQSCAAKSFGASQILCPFDRRATPIADVNELSKNFALLEVLEMREAMEKRKEGREQMKKEKEKEKEKEKCVDNGAHDGEWFCVSCTAVFCESCFTKHHSKSFNSHHEKLPISERPYQLPKCPKHPKNLAEFICTQPTCLTKNFCQTCLFTTHKDHGFEELEVKINTKKEELRGQLDDVSCKRAKLETTLRQLDMFAKVYSRESGEHRQLMEEVEEWFVNRLHVVARRVTQHWESQLGKVREMKEKVEEDLGKVNGWSRELKNAIGANVDFDFERVEEVLMMAKEEKKLGENVDIGQFDTIPNCDYFCSTK